MSLPDPRPRLAPARLLLVGTSLLLAGCASSKPDAAANGPTPFSRFADDYFDALYAFAPSQGTAVGFHQYDARLEDRSAAAFSAVLPHAYAFDPANPSETRRLTEDYLRVASEVPIVRLTYSPDFETFPTVVTAVLDTIEALPAPVGPRNAVLR